jgi:hypothetical protein
MIEFRFISNISPFWIQLSKRLPAWFIKKQIIERSETAVFLDLVYLENLIVFYCQFDKTMPAIKLIAPHFSQVVGMAVGTAYDHDSSLPYPISSS